VRESGGKKATSKNPCKIMKKIKVTQPGK
jgi:hypothetical protein